MALFISRFSKEYKVIQSVVDSFYEKAKSDIIIGYHFRHIEDFDKHLPKIYLFWALQVLELNKEEKKEILSHVNLENIVKKHKYLKVKKGEIGRWVLLFQQIIESQFKKYKETNLQELKSKMTRKTEVFHQIFLNSSELFVD
jgi:hypothetical protein